MLEFLSEPCSGEIAFEMNGVRWVVHAREVSYSIKGHSDPFAGRYERDTYSATLEVRDALAVEEQESYESVCARLRRSEAALAEARKQLAALREAASNTCRFLQRNVGGLEVLADYGRTYATSLMAVGAEGYDEAALAATAPEGGETP